LPLEGFPLGSFGLWLSILGRFVDRAFGTLKKLDSKGIVAPLQLVERTLDAVFGVGEVQVGGVAV
jgi:hypothetical protein